MIEQSVSLASNGVVKVPGYEQLVRFGYTKNRGVYRLAVTATGEWEGLTIRAFWHVPDGKDPASSLVVGGYVAVPASVTAQPGSGCVTFEGSDGTKTVTSADLRYRVSSNSGTEDGTEPEPGTPAWQELVGAVHTDATAAEQAKVDAQTAAQQAGASAKKAGQALSDTITAKEDALKAIGDKQTSATQAVDTARDKALEQVEASTEAAQTAASEAATSAGNADQSAQEAADSLQELKDGIASGDFKGEPGNDGKSPVVTVTDIENGHRVSITDKDGTKTIDVLNGKDGKDAPQIDDTTVTDSAPWSSKHIVDMLCPPMEETGNPVTCYPVAGYPLGCKASWEPTQDGEGTPYPAGGGPNLLDISQCTATVGKPYGVTITIDGDVFKVSGVPSSEVTEEGQYSFAVASCTQTELRGKGYKITPFALKGDISSAWGLRTEDEDSLAIAAKLTPGVNNDIQLRLMVSKDTPTAYAPYENIRPIRGRDSVAVTRCGENLLNPSLFQNNKYQNFNAATGYYEVASEDGYWISGIQPCSPNTTYRFNKNVEGGCFYDEKKNVIGIVGFDFTFKTPAKCAYYCVNFSSGSTPYGTPVIATVSESTPTTYAPYTGQTTALTLPHTIYGGTVDAVTGEGQETRKLITLDGTEAWTVSGKFLDDKSDWYYVSSRIPGAVNESPRKGNEICSHYPHADVANNNAVKGCAIVWGAIRVRWGDTIPDNADGWKSYLSAQYAAGTPVQVAYKLAEPIPFTATGAQPIPALSGANTVLTDADKLTVTGRADPIKRITDLEDAVASMTNT